MKVLMIGVDKTSVGGMLTVVENYLNNKEFCDRTHLKYVATVIRASKFTKIKTFISKLPEIISIIRKDKIDIVHVHMAERGSVFREGFVIWIAHILGCKTVAHMHGATIEDWYNEQNFLMKKIISGLFRLPDKMIVLGENWRPFMVSAIGKKGEKKVVVLHNAVKISESNQYNIEATNVLFYGMLIQRKGIDDLLEAFYIIQNQIPKQIKLMLYGDDHDSQEKIVEKIKRYKLEERVHYKGWLTPDNRETVFKNTIINVLPSYNEGLPMTILESMGYGIPNISTNIAAIPEAIQDGINGYLIEPGDVKSLAETMKKIIMNTALRDKLSGEAYTVIRDEFSMEYHIARLLDIYRSLF